MRALFQRMSDFDRRDLSRTAQDVADILRSERDMPSKARRLFAMGSQDRTTATQVRRVARKVRRRGGRAARQTGSYIMANPRRSGGIGVGTVAVAALGAFAIYKLKAAQKETDETLLLETDREPVASE